jgi:NADH:ubiquinone oxidoreductase subunit K
MPRVGFEPTIPVFERAEAVLALNRAVTVIGINSLMLRRNNIECIRFLKNDILVESYQLKWTCGDNTVHKCHNIINVG